MLTAQPGKSLEYAAAAAIIAERAKPKWVEITVLGSPTREGDQMSLKAAVSGEPFRLADDPEAKSAKKATPYQKLEQALAQGAKVVSVAGKVEEAKTKEGEKKPPPKLIVTGFEREDAE